METENSPPWDDLRVLLALHRHRSFLAAGKALGVSTSTAARRVEALEAALGRSLVHRSSGGTSVEPEALELVALAEQIELGLRAIRRDEAAQPLSGTVRVSVGEGVVQPVTRVLCELRRAHPQLHLEITSEARLVDLARREADIALRLGKSQHASVVQRAIGRVQFGLYASAGYVERRLRGGRLTLADLPRHDFVAEDRAIAGVPKTTWLASHGADRFVVRSNSDFAIVEATQLGQGIALLADAVVRGISGLVRLTIDAELPSMPLYLAYHRDLKNVPRVRLVLDAMDAALREALR